MEVQFTVSITLLRQVKATTLRKLKYFKGDNFQGNLYAIGGPENFGNLYGKTTQGYIINLETGKLINTFNGGDEGFKMPHDIAVTQDGSFVYVVEINPFRIWKLSTGIE